MTFGLDEHTHRFAVWAGARAAQRGSTGFKVVEFNQAIKNTGLQSAIQTAASEAWTDEAYNIQHSEWCLAILNEINAIKTERVKSETDDTTVTFGRAAKAVSVYVKAAFVIRDQAAHRSFVSVAHPPVDRELLKGVKRAFKEEKFGISLTLDPNIKGRVRKLNATKEGWTGFDARAYGEVINLLRTLNGPDRPFWMIEEHWKPND